MYSGDRSLATEGVGLESSTGVPLEHGQALSHRFRTRRPGRPSAHQGAALRRPRAGQAHRRDTLQRGQGTLHAPRAQQLLRTFTRWHARVVRHERDGRAEFVDYRQRTRAGGRHDGSAGGNLRQHPAAGESGQRGHHFGGTVPSGGGERRCARGISSGRRPLFDGQTRRGGSSIGRGLPRRHHRERRYILRGPGVAPAARTRTCCARSKVWSKSFSI